MPFIKSSIDLNKQVNQISKSYHLLLGIFSDVDALELLARLFKL